MFPPFLDIVWVYCPDKEDPEAMALFPHKCSSNCWKFDRISLKKLSIVVQVWPELSGIKDGENNNW